VSLIAAPRGGWTLAIQATGGMPPLVAHVVPPGHPWDDPAAAVLRHRAYLWEPGGEGFTYVEGDVAYRYVVATGEEQRLVRLPEVFFTVPTDGARQLYYVQRQGRSVRQAITNFATRSP
jgi:hypothetical protein